MRIWDAEIRASWCYVHQSPHARCTSPAAPVPDAAPCFLPHGTAWGLCTGRGHPTAHHTGKTRSPPVPIPHRPRPRPHHASPTSLGTTRPHSCHYVRLPLRSTRHVTNAFSTATAPPAPHRRKHRTYAVPQTVPACAGGRAPCTTQRSSSPTARPSTTRSSPVQPRPTVGPACSGFPPYHQAHW